MKNFIGNFVLALVLATPLVWFGASIAEVNAKNLEPHPWYSEWNLFCVLMDDRIEEGTYYERDGGTVVTDNGHEWGYGTNIADGTRVQVVFDDKGTTDITDDVITRLGVSK